MPKRPRDFVRRLAPPLAARDLRARGGSSSSLSGLRFADDFFGRSSSAATRSCGPRRSSASEAASPNSGSLRPPLFFRPHAILKTLLTPGPPHASGRGLRVGYGKVNAGLGGAAARGKERQVSK